MKCILHVGTAKTATTTIQEFLQLNKQALGQQGYLYTESAGRGNNKNLAIAALNATTRNDFTRNRNLDSDEKLLTYQAQIIEDLKAEIVEAQNARPSGYQTIVFSSEFIHSNLRTVKELSRLKSLLHRIGCTDIQILLYLRSPVDLATSLYSTAVKKGYADSGPPTPTQERYNYFHNVCDHRSTLIRFSEVFGRSAIHPRLYLPQTLKDSCILSDFLTAVGVEAQKSAFQIPENKNKRLSAAGLEILRRVNQRVPAFIEEQPCPLRSNLDRHFSAYLTKGPAYTMPAALSAQYETTFKESNEWVRKHYFPHRESLFPKAVYPNFSQHSLDPEVLESIADMIASIWLEKQTQLQKKQAQLQKKQAQFQKKQTQLQKKQTQLQSKQDQLQSTQDQLQNKKALITSLTNRKSYRVAKKIGEFKQWLRQLRPFGAVE